MDLQKILRIEGRCQLFDGKVHDEFAVVGVGQGVVVTADEAGDVTQVDELGLASKFGADALYIVGLTFGLELGVDGRKLLVFPLGGF